MWSSTSLPSWGQPVRIRSPALATVSILKIKLTIMETFYFLAGVCAVIVAMMVVGMFVNYMHLNKIKKQIIDLSRNIEEVDRDRDKQNSDQIDYTDTLNNNVHDELNKLYGYIDSRTDKMADGISKDIESINRKLEAISKHK